jgi:hypothetical protein
MSLNYIGNTLIHHFEENNTKYDIFKRNFDGGYIVFVNSPEVPFYTRTFTTLNEMKFWHKELACAVKCKEDEILSGVIVSHIPGGI